MDDIASKAAEVRGRCLCGAIGWTFSGEIPDATMCNCTACRRYGVLWAYDYEGERIRVSGRSTSYTRKDTTKPALEILFCPVCGCVMCWRGLGPGPDGRRRIAVNLRLTEPDAIAHLPIDHFDGLVDFDDLPRDGRCVQDMWF